MENVFIGVFMDSQPMGAMKFNSIDDVTTEFLDQFFDAGYELEKFTKEQFDECIIGDELYIEDVLNDNFFIENN